MYRTSNKKEKTLNKCVFSDSVPGYLGDLRIDIRCCLNPYYKIGHFQGK
jgi:hypothetical protein